jgi:hypothetical protein
MPPLAAQIPYDLTRPYPSRAPVWNQGCPPGYFCEWVPRGTPGAADYGNPDYGLLCRSVESVTPDALVADAGWAWDTAVAEQSMDAYNAAVAETSGHSWWWWVAAGVVAAMLLRGGHGDDAPGWLGHRRGQLL